jgi:hypothetical protein
VSEPTTLDPNEAAIVTTGRMTGLEMLFPDLPEDCAVPELGLALSVCFIRLTKEPAFVAEMLDWMQGISPKDREVLDS